MIQNKPVLTALAAAVMTALVAGCDDETTNIIEVTPSSIALTQIGRYESNVFDDGAAEIVAYHAPSQRLFVINASATTVDVLDIADPTSPTLVETIDASTIDGIAYGGANSVAINGDLMALAIEADTKTDPGIVAFYDATNLGYLGQVTVGALPDMVTFTPDGTKVLVANEGEPSDDYLQDPPGSVSVIDLIAGVAGATVEEAGFTAFNGEIDALRAMGVRISGPGATVAEDLEPEYITISEDSGTAWVTLQENNALAVVDIETATVTNILPLGTKDYARLGNEIDASNRDGGINLAQWPVKGMYMPDAIASYSFNGKTYLVTANEGDARDYDTFTEEFRIADLTLDATAFPDAAELQSAENLGRLRVSSVSGFDPASCNPSQRASDVGDLDGNAVIDVDDVAFYVENNCEYDELYAYGARSFTIWDAATGTVVYDSGNEMELITALRAGDDFNSDNAESQSGDSRSDDKGPEPEGVIVGEVDGRNYAFIGLERVGGIMVYDVTNPEKPAFVQYMNNRDFAVDLSVDVAPADGVPDNLSAAGDLGPEGLVFIPAADSPITAPLLVVGNEVSGTTTVYRIDPIR